MMLIFFNILDSRRSQEIKPSEENKRLIPSRSLVKNKTGF